MVPLAPGALRRFVVVQSRAHRKSDPTDSHRSHKKKHLDKGYGLYAKCFFSYKELTSKEQISPRNQETILPHILRR